MTNVSLLSSLSLIVQSCLLPLNSKALKENTAVMGMGVTKTRGYQASKNMFCQRTEIPGDVHVKKNLNKQNMTHSLSCDLKEVLKIKASGCSSEL